jgi:hypothetical protein
MSKVEKPITGYAVRQPYAQALEFLNYPFMADFRQTQSLLSSRNKSHHELL